MAASMPGPSLPKLNSPEEISDQKRKFGALCVMYYTCCEEEREKKKWIPDLIGRQQVGLGGTHVEGPTEAQQKLQSLLREMKEEDANEYKDWKRFMDDETYDDLRDKVAPLITKKNTVMREAISAETRLDITLRYLATGETFHSLRGTFRVSRRVISEIVIQTCDALIEVLKDYLKVPTSEDEWWSVAKTYYDVWNYPNCIGAVDAKHIMIGSSFNSGSHFSKYKGQRSIILMALIDADLRFLYVDVGANGRDDDGNVWNRCDLQQMLSQYKLNLPAPTRLPGSQKVTPFVIVGNDAFPFGSQLMKPFSGNVLQPQERVFNYRLLRAHRCSENAFGVLSARWRVFRGPIALEPAKVIKVTLAACSLHNYLLTRTIARSVYMPDSLLDVEDVQSGAITQGSWREFNWKSVRRTEDNNCTYVANNVREIFKLYFNYEGAVTWYLDAHLYN